MTIKTGFLKVFAKIMVFCGIMMGLFFAPAYADDACKNLFDISKVPSANGVVNNGDGTLTVTGYPAYPHRDQNYRL